MRVNVTVRSPVCPAAQPPRSYRPTPSSGVGRVCEKLCRTGARAMIVGGSGASFRAFRISHAPATFSTPLPCL